VDSLKIMSVASLRSMAEVYCLRMDLALNRHKQDGLDDVAGA